MSSIALVVMTKNGHYKIPNLLTSVETFVDRVCVLDTGSTDNTLMVIANWGEKTGIPIEYEFADFVDFGTTRTVGLKYAKDTADWLLLLDDDMTLHGMFNDVKQSLDLNVPCYLLRMDQNTTYWTPRLIRGDRDWEYKGVTHEYLDRSIEAVKLERIFIRHQPMHTPAKFERDLKLLSADIARDPNDPRTIFYLAQTLRDMGQIQAAIRYYEMRAKMGGWYEEVYYAKYEAARLAGDPAAMEQAYLSRPSRAEAPHWLARHYQHLKDYGRCTYWERVRANIPMTKDILFVDQTAYETAKSKSVNFAAPPATYTP